MTDVSELIRNLRLEGNPYSVDAADALEAQIHEIERLRRFLVACAKLSSRDEGAIPDMVVDAIGDANYDNIGREISDEELYALAYPSETP